MTAVEWLVKIYLQTNKIDSFDIEQAKEMEKQMVIDIVEKSRETGLTAEYLLLTYGSKGSDETKNDPSEIEEYTSCPICNGTSINGFCSTPNCAYSLYEPNKDDLEMTPTSSQKEISDDCIKCDYCSKVVKKFMAIDVWMITDNNKNVCYECQIKNHIGYGEQKGILVELMELDSKDGLYESVTISSPQYIPEISDEEIEKESYIKFPILTYSVMEGHDDFNRVMRDSWVEGIKWYKEQLKGK